MCASMKYQMLSQIFRDTKGCGITWAKMLNVSIAVAYPELRLLDSQCDVGIGALAPLQCCWECAKCIRPLADVRSITQTPAQTRAPTQDAVHVACPRWCAAACSICRPNSDDEWTIVRGSPSPPSVENLHNKYGLRKGDPMMNNLPSKRTAGDSKPPARRQKVDNDAQVDAWCFAIVLYVSLFLCLSVCIQSKVGRVERLNG